MKGLNSHLQLNQLKAVFVNQSMYYLYYAYDEADEALITYDLPNFM